MYYTGEDYRGDIQLSKDLKAELVSQDRFDLYNQATKTRKYFRVYQNDSAKNWVKVINKVIKHMKSE